MKWSILIASLLLGAMLTPTRAGFIVFVDAAGVGLDKAIDRAGNVYFTGVHTGDPNSPYYHFTVKYDNKGKKLWERGYPDATGNWGMCAAIATGRQGNAYVTGHTMIHERTTEDDDTVFGYVTIKYDADGKQLWKALYDEPNKVLINAVDVAVDEKSNVYVTGSSSDPDPTFGPNMAEKTNDEIWTPPDSDIVIIKYNSSGNQLWAAKYGGKESHENSPHDIALGPNGSVYITGHSTVDEGMKGIDSYATTIKYNMHGKQQWLARFSGEPNATTSSGTLALDHEGNVYVAGSSSSHGRPDYSDFVTVKYDRNGRQLWMANHRVSGKMWAFSTAIALSPDGNVYVTGEASPRWSGPGFPPDDAISSLKQTKLVTLKYDANGKQLWVATYKEPERGVFPRDLIIDVSGNTYVIGKDALVIKYDGHGNQKWARWFKNAAELAILLGSLKR